MQIIWIFIFKSTVFNNDSFIFYLTNIGFSIYNNFNNPIPFIQNNILNFAFSESSFLKKA